MDAHRFDRIAKILAIDPSRRGMLRGVASLALGGALVATRQEDAEGARCRPPGAPCRKFTQCCSGKCNKRRDKCEKCPEHFKWCQEGHQCIWKTDCCTDADCEDSPEGDSCHSDGSCCSVDDEECI